MLSASAVAGSIQSITRAGLRQHPRAFRRLLGLLAFAVIANVAFLVATRSVAAQVIVARPEESPRVTLAAAMGDRGTLVATVTDDLILIADGRVVRRIKYPSVIGGLAVDPERGVIYVGSAAGKVSVLNHDLQPVTEVPVSGRVVALAPAADGGFFAAHGVGVYSDRYWVSYYATPSPKATFDHRVEFTITDLSAAKGVVAYSTANGRVGALQASDGKSLWTVTVTRPVTRLTVIPSAGAVFTGDDRGNLTLLDGDTGQARWVVNVTPYPIHSVSYEARSGFYLAGDEQGHVYALDSSGRTVFAGVASTNPIEALLPEAAGLVAVPRDGSWFSVQPAAIRGANIVRLLRLGWYGVDALLIIAMGVAAIAAIPEGRNWTRRLAISLYRSRTAYGFILPSFCLIVLFSYYPAAMAFYDSLTNFSLRNVTAFVGLQNYVTILTTDFYFRVGITNMLIILATGVLKVLTVPLLVAELVFWVKHRVHRYIFRTLVVFPAVVPGLVTTLLWRLIYDPNVGALNEFLRVIGAGNLARAWLGDEHTALWAIIAAGFPFLSAFAFLIYLGGLLNVNVDLYDAAQIDGANWLRRFLHIDIPLLEPQFRLLLFFAFAGSIQGFANVYVFTQGGPGYATYVPALEMYFRISDGDFGYASAIGVLLFALIFIGTVGILRFQRRENV